MTTGTTDSRKVKARDLTRTQRAALRRIVRYYRNATSYTGCTSVRYELKTYRHFASVIVETRRSDCDEYSPRQILCRHRGRFFIGKRGAIRVVTSREGLTDNAAHVAHMIGGKIEK